MSEKKYQKNVIEAMEQRVIRPLFDGKVSPVFEFDKSCYTDSEIWMHSSIIYAPGAGMGCGDQWDRVLPDGSIEPHVASRHRHNADEIFIFHGTDPQNPFELGGEVKFWLGRGEDEEEFTITKPTVVYIPADTWHNPNWYARVDRPFIELVVMVSKENTEFSNKRYLEKTHEYPKSFLEQFGEDVKPFWPKDK